MGLRVGPESLSRRLVACFWHQGLDRCDDALMFKGNFLRHGVGSETGLSRTAVKYRVFFANRDQTAKCLRKWVTELPTGLDKKLQMCNGYTP
jgi:hypothetical protein